jgi:DNA-binding transcriptional LysR family regulator
MHEMPREDEQVQKLAASLVPRLALLRALGDERHVTKAAAALGMPQPTVSRWLARLGRELGAPVVVRVGRGVQLTRAGELLTESANHALRALEAGCRRAMEEVDPNSGHVVFAFLHTMGGVRVPELLRGFRENHPGVRFTLLQAAHEEMLSKLRGGEADLALTSPLPAEEPSLRSAALHEEPLVLAAAEGHRLADRKRVRISELAEENLVGMKSGYGLRKITDELCTAAGFAPRLAFEGDDVDTVRGLVAAGLGLALLPPAESWVPPGMVEIPVTPRATRTIGLVWMAGRPLPAAVRTFRDFAIHAAAGARADRATVTDPAH